MYFLGCKYHHIRTKFRPVAHAPAPWCHGLALLGQFAVLALWQFGWHGAKGQATNDGNEPTMMRQKGDGARALHGHTFHSIETKQKHRAQFA